MILVGLVLVKGGSGCDRQAPPEPGDPLRSRRSDEDDLGSVTYRRYCIGCHGEAGDGKGPAARFLFPPPRDFTRGLYKFTTTPGGSLPTEDDLLRTITRGLRGTAMPSFRLLSRAEKRALLGTIKRFYVEWETTPPSSPVTLHANPFDMDPEFREEVEEAVRRGEEIYHAKAECWKCHPVYVRGERLEEIARKHQVAFDQRENPDEGVLKEDSWGQMIPPPDFRTMKLKSVFGLDDLYRVIAAGVGGTAMPTWVESLGVEELWALTLYVWSLTPEGGRQLTAESSED